MSKWRISQRIWSRVLNCTIFISLLCSFHKLCIKNKDTIRKSSRHFQYRMRCQKNIPINHPSTPMLMWQWWLLTVYLRQLPCQPAEPFLRSKLTNGRETDRMGIRVKRTGFRTSCVTMSRCNKWIGCSWVEYRTLLGGVSWDASAQKVCTEARNYSKELDQAVKQAKFSAGVIVKMREEYDDENKKVKYFVGDRELSVVNEAVKLGLIYDPTEYMAEQSRLQLILLMSYGLNQKKDSDKLLKTTRICSSVITLWIC